MYEQIFDDFNTIKQHYERNGKNQFEESAVFELLESLYPLHGSVQAVQTIIEMLDAQSIRDSKSTIDNSTKNLSDCEKLNNDDENDNDIIEIEIPKKIHPIIDLTENSTESDEAVIIEKSENKSTVENIEINSDSNVENNDSEASSNEIQFSWSDSEASKPFNEDSSLNCEDFIRSNSEKQLLNYLAILDQSNQVNQSSGEQSNNDAVHLEMLEENNNDPNNNFDEENADANQSINNNLNRTVAVLSDTESTNSNRSVDILHDSESVNLNRSNILHDYESPNSQKVLDEFNEVFNELFNPVPIPGSSIEVTSNFEANGASKPASNYNLFNPVPGCSKDLDISQSMESFKTNDDSIEKDITCIQEIIPWAASNEIRFLLLKYSNISDRKQATLLKLMKEESNRIKTQSIKRKSDNDTIEIENKIPKTDTTWNYEMDDTLDMIPTLQLDNILSNESSNDSQSSKRSGHLETSLKINESLPTSSNTEFSKASLENKCSHSDSNSNPSLNLVSSNTPAIPNLSSNMSTANHTIKKERNETVVSGLLQEQRHLEMLNGKNLNEASFSASSKTLKQSINEPFSANSNDIQFSFYCNLLSPQISDKTIEKTVKEEADNILNDIPTMNDFVNNSKNIQSSNQSRVVIQPPKLLLQNFANSTIVEIPSKSNFMRPAILKFNNSQPGSQKIIMPEAKDNLKEDLRGGGRLYSNYAATRQNDYIPPALRLIKKQEPVPNRIQLAPSATIVHENQAERNLSNLIKTPIAIGTHRKKHNVIRYHNRPEKLETLVEPSIKTQPRPLVRNPVSQPGTSGLSSGAASTSNHILDQSIYNKLRSIFPDVKASYIKKICITPPNVGNMNDKAYILNALIEHLLNEGSNHLRPVEYIIDQPTIASVTVDEKYEYLLGIFPDADPTYIRDFVVRNPSEQDFEEFIQQKLESRDYPTKEQYMARIKITEQIKQYTTDLNIEKFLELFPDPFKHFEDASRKCVYQPIAMEFLKSLFVKNKVLTISQQYKRNKYNLSMTARALIVIGPDMKSKRVSVEMPTEDIPLLQEMAFIKNKQNITNHLNMLKNKEEQLFKELKEQNLLITCQCCYNDECMPTKSSECNEGHVFCHECIIRGTESALADAEAHVRCFTDCQSEFSLATLQKVLPPTKFSALLQKRQTAEVMAAGVDGLVSCPFCHFASIPPPEDKVFKCLNPECMKESCKLCKELNHVPLKCDEVIKVDKARHILEEKMTEALVRTCYQCKKQFYKEDGCNKMKCTCGALMCYLCSKPVKGYNHFNAQGGANTHLCPLWSDDRLLNAKAVIKVAEDVKKVLLKNNPDLKIDTDSLLPKIPPKTRGPHDDIPNANQLPEHIMRIANAAQR